MRSRLSNIFSATRKEICCGELDTNKPKEREEANQEGRSSSFRPNVENSQFLSDKKQMRLRSGVAARCGRALIKKARSMVQSSVDGASSRFTHKVCCRKHGFNLYSNRTGNGSSLSPFHSPRLPFVDMSMSTSPFCASLLPLPRRQLDQLPHLYVMLLGRAVTSTSVRIGKQVELFSFHLESFFSRFRPLLLIRSTWLLAEISF